MNLGNAKYIPTLIKTHTGPHGRAKSAPLWTFARVVCNLSLLSKTLYWGGTTGPEPVVHLEPLKQVPGPATGKNLRPVTLLVFPQNSPCLADGVGGLNAGTTDPVTHPAKQADC